MSNISQRYHTMHRARDHPPQWHYHAKTKASSSAALASVSAFALRYFAAAVNIKILYAHTELSSMLENVLTLIRHSGEENNGAPKKKKQNSKLSFYVHDYNLFAYIIS